MEVLQNLRIPVKEVVSKLIPYTYSLNLLDSEFVEIGRWEGKTYLKNSLEDIKLGECFEELLKRYIRNEPIALSSDYEQALSAVSKEGADLLKNGVPYFMPASFPQNVQLHRSISGKADILGQVAVGFEPLLIL